MGEWTRRGVIGGAAASALARASAGTSAQLIEPGPGRVVTSLDVSLPPIGSVRPRGVAEIGGSNWLLRCETLDRGYADYDAYKAYLAPLGIRRLRFQAGWARTERERGRYDFAWLDHIIDDAVGRYRDRVFDWEVWNEPNFGDNSVNTPEMAADLNVRTARIIKRLQSNARVSGLALGHFDRAYVDRFFEQLARRRAFDLFDTMTYHDYAYNPDANVANVEAIRASLRRHTRRVRLRQGENGAPSAGGSGRGALGDYPWSELSQAKWDVRRMLGNLGMDVECSVFSIVEMAYTDGPIRRMNFKGLLKSDEQRRVVRPKTAYYAVQNVAALFDDRLERLADLRATFNPGAAEGVAYAVGTDRAVATFGYRSRVSGKHLYSLWLSDAIPSDSVALLERDLTLVGAEVDDPVWVDVVTGGVFAIPADRWRREGRAIRFWRLPLYDSPVLVADRRLVGML